MLHFGRHGHRMWIRADMALMIFLRRMAAPSRWCDLHMILGGSRTVLSDTFNHLTSIFYDRYSGLICNVNIWVEEFPTFAARMHSLGCPHDNIVMFVDGHFQPTCRPGGDGCVNLNLFDYQTFLCKERDFINLPQHTQPLITGCAKL